jgi:hypothetical protein
MNNVWLTMKLTGVKNVLIEKIVKAIKFLISVYYKIKKKLRGK